MAINRGFSIVTGIITITAVGVAWLTTIVTWVGVATIIVVVIVAWVMMVTWLWVRTWVVVATIVTLVRDRYSGVSSISSNRFSRDDSL